MYYRYSTFKFRPSWLKWLVFMVYREWFYLKYKVLAWLIVYAGWAVIFLFLHVWPNQMYVFFGDWGNFDVYDTLFNKWLASIALMTPVLALIGGVDLVSEERNKNTLSFLLTQPISRTRIYVTKVLLNGGGFTGIIALSSLLILLVDQLPRTINVVSYIPCNNDAKSLCTAITPGPGRPIELDWAIMGLALVLLFGVFIVFITGLFSIRCRNVIQTIGAASPVVVVVYMYILGAGNKATHDGITIGRGAGPIFESNLIVVDNNLLLTWLIALAILCFGLFFLGVKVFNRAEF